MRRLSFPRNMSELGRVGRFAIVPPVVVVAHLAELRGLGVNLTGDLPLGGLILNLLRVPSWRTGIP
jgi:hypothetical protein